MASRHLLFEAAPVGQPKLQAFRPYRLLIGLTIRVPMFLTSVACSPVNEGTVMQEAAKASETGCHPSLNQKQYHNLIQLILPVLEDCGLRES